jgi:hypothetical protein
MGRSMGPTGGVFAASVIPRSLAKETTIVSARSWSRISVSPKALTSCEPACCSARLPMRISRTLPLCSFPSTRAVETPWSAWAGEAAMPKIARAPNPITRNSPIRRENLMMRLRRET